MAYFYPFGNNKNERESEAASMSDKQKNKEAKAYEKYAGQFTPKPRYIVNMFKAFIVGGTVCVLAGVLQDYIIRTGTSEVQAGSIVTAVLIMTAQLLTGIGVFDKIAKFAGAGVIVPITGFANSMVAPAIEYKKEGHVFGIGCKIFTIAGPVILYGVFTSWVLGVVYWVLQMMGVA